MNQQQIATKLEEQFPQYQGKLHYLGFQLPSQHVFKANKDEIVVTNENCDDVFEVFINEGKAGNLK